MLHSKTKWQLIILRRSKPPKMPPQNAHATWGSLLNYRLLRSLQPDIKPTWPCALDNVKCPFCTFILVYSRIGFRSINKQTVLGYIYKIVIIGHCFEERRHVGAVFSPVALQSAWDSSGCSAFFPQSKDMWIRLTGCSKLSTGSTHNG